MNRYGRGSWHSRAIGWLALGPVCLQVCCTAPAAAQSGGLQSGWPIEVQRAVDQGYWAPVAVAGFLVIWHLLRGRVLIAGGWSGKTIVRNTRQRRVLHWVQAAAFFALAVTGFASLYWERAFGTPLSPLNGVLHTWASVLFIVALALTFIGSAPHLMPTRYDLAWIRAGGVLLGNRRQPPAGRLTATQKAMFLFLLVSGALAAATGYGAFGLPPASSRGWHAAAGVMMISVVVAHAYFRTLGMQGSFDAMRTGEVDINWAKQHHSVWAEDELWRAADREEAVDRDQVASYPSSSTLRP